MGYTLAEMGWTGSTRFHGSEQRSPMMENRDFRDTDDETRRNMEITESLCHRHRLNFQFNGLTVTIQTFAGTWRFDLDRSFVRLYHRNYRKLHHRDFHHQRDFADVFMAIEYIMQHDAGKYQPVVDGEKGWRQ